MARRLHLVAAAALVLVSQAVPLAQRPTFRTETALVNLNVTVVGAGARHVSGLGPDDFEVREDGVPQSLQYFAAGDTPLDVLLLLDTSSSMAECLPLVQEAASRFARALRPVDRVGVMTIADGLRIVHALTADTERVTSAIQSTRARGRTRLYSSMYAALLELAKVRREPELTPRRQAIVLLSDGRDTSSAFSFGDLQSEVRRHAVPIYVIAPRPARDVRRMRELAFGESTTADDFELRALATDTGALAFFPVTLKDLAGIYESIADELAHQYSLGYESSNPAADGAFRRIALRVNAPGVTWRTRTGYISDADRVSSAHDQR